MTANARRQSARPRVDWALFLAALGLSAAPCPAIITSNLFTPIQMLVGAERFYNEGYFGFNSVIANVESGHIWDRHEVFSQPAGPGVYFSQDPSLDTTFPQRQYDIHATAVGSVLGGIGPFQPGIGYLYYQFGMAPGAALISSAIATAWPNNSGEFSYSPESFNSGYTIPMRDGVPIEIFGPGTGLFVQLRADVVNSSWGYADATGSSHEAHTIDALIAAYRQVFCYAAGNHEGNNQVVVGPASGYNGIAVAALASDLSVPQYGSVATFSNVGPNAFHNPKLNLDVPAARAAVDISAPGTDLIAAAYTGPTGSNTGQVDPFPGSTEVYVVGVSGTSFASPIVAGGAALMVGAARSRLPVGSRATDALVVKAALLNSATKTENWTNNPRTSLVAGPSITTQGLDYAAGAGALNLNRAFDQYFSGDTDLPGLGGGLISVMGWDYGNVSANVPNDYRFITALSRGDQLTATLDWMIHRSFDDLSQESSEEYFNDLDLELWRIVNGVPFELVASSASLYNNVEHLYFAIPQDGEYALRVLFFGNTFDVPGNSPLLDEYAVAWHVPEPGSLCLASVAAVLMPRRRSRPTAK